MGAAIVLLVLVIVVAGRLFGHSSPNQGALPQSQPQSVTSYPASVAPSDTTDSDPTANPSGSPLLHKPEPPAQPSGAAEPATVAKSFAQAWLHHDNVTAQAWLDGLTPYATSALLAQLNGVDPSTVPASRLTKDVTIENDTRTDCVAEAATDTGVLTLSLQLAGGRWVVSNIDWARS